MTNNRKKIGFLLINCFFRMKRREISLLGLAFIFNRIQSSRVSFIFKDFIRSNPMCRQTTCSKCGKATWAGKK